MSELSTHLARQIEASLRQIERDHRREYPDGIPANVRIAELLKVFPGFSFTVYPTDPLSGRSSIDVVPPAGPGFRLMIDAVE